MSIIFVVFAFSFALCASLLLTPLARKLGMRMGALDLPDARKVHVTPTPRTGGLAILVVGLVSAAGVMWYAGDAVSAAENGKLLFVLAGAVICFATGLVDDFRSLSAGFKLLMQIIAASVAFVGGAQIGMGAFADFGLLGFWLSYGVTVLWFLLFINAVNLIDGLDGLAGGVSFCVAMVMVVVSVLGDNYLLATLFAVLAGSILGFLRYNFNPASIFLGDGGSYFIGFVIAGLSILGNLKEQTGVAMLIPMIALGLPLFDTVVSSARRFVRGHNVFGADRRHVHHRLLDMGLTTRRAVLLMYLVTLALCVVALVVVNMRDDKTGLILALLFVGAVVFSRELGYFRDLHPGHVRRWLADVWHVTGASRQRRALFDVQLGISRARSGEELWPHVVQALELMSFDHACLYLDSEHRGVAGDVSIGTASGDGSSGEPESQPVFTWDKPADLTEPTAVASKHGKYFYRLELPLVCEKTGHVFGMLVLVKDHRLGAISQFTLQWVEHLRRAVMHALDAMAVIAAAGGVDRRSGGDDGQQRARSSQSPIPRIANSAVDHIKLRARR